MCFSMDISQCRLVNGTVNFDKVTSVEVASEMMYEVVQLSLFFSCSSLHCLFHLSFLSMITTRYFYSIHLLSGDIYGGPHFPGDQYYNSGISILELHYLVLLVLS